MERDIDIATTPESTSSATMSTLGSQGMQEFLRYFMASAVALSVDVGALYVLTSVLGTSYLYSGAIAFVLGLLTIYILSIVWVFEHRTARSPIVEFSIFAVIGVVGLGINELVLWIGTGVLSFHYLLSKVGSVIVVFTWNFFARKYALFR